MLQNEREYKQTIKDCWDVNNAVEFLSKKLDINEEDSKWITKLQIIQLTKIETEKVKKQIKIHKDEIKLLKSELSKVRRRIFNQL